MHRELQALLLFLLLGRFIFDMHICVGFRSIHMCSVSSPFIQHIYAIRFNFLNDSNFGAYMIYVLRVCLFCNPKFICICHAQFGHKYICVYIIHILFHDMSRELTYQWVHYFILDYTYICDLTILLSFAYIYIPRSASKFRSLFWFSDFSYIYIYIYI